MLKHMRLNEMVALTSPWVNDPDRKGVFLSIAEIAALHGKVIKAYQAVLAVQPAKAGISPALRAVLDKLELKDFRYDHLARAISLGLEAHGAHCLADDPSDVDAAAHCQEIQLKLFPTGLAIVNVSLLAESGNTARVAHLLQEEPSIGDFLKTIPAPKNTTLFDTTKRWILVGAEMGELERQREVLVAKEAVKPASNASVQAARSQWIRVVSQVLALLEDAEAPAESIELIRGPVLRASERAARRYERNGDEESALDEDVKKQGEETAQ